jgi:hypothetical protein
MAVLTTELPVNPDPLAHRNPACNINITVTSFRVCGKSQTGLLKQDRNTLRSDLFCYRVTGSFLHGVILAQDCAKLSAYWIKKER